jgi:hypothetical protein
MHREVALEALHRIGAARHDAGAGAADFRLAGGAHFAERRGAGTRLGLLRRLRLLGRLGGFGWRLGLLRRLLRSLLLLPLLLLLLWLLWLLWLLLLALKKWRKKLRLRPPGVQQHARTNGAAG